MPAIVSPSNLLELAEGALVARMRAGEIDVPPYPAVALRLGELVRDEDYGLAEVTRVISADQVLSADLLRCANSAFYARGGEVTSLSQAVTRVGAHEVVRLAVASSLATATRQPGPLQPLKRRAWQGGIASAILCQELARARGLVAEDAFLCGLLHDFGWVVGLSALEEVLREMPGLPPQPVLVWTSLLDRLHVELGLVVAERWKLPTLIIEAIAQHHDRQRRRIVSAPLIDVVAASDQVIQLLGRYPSVTLAELIAVPGLTAAEREALARAIPGIPAVINSFEHEPEGRQPASGIEPPPIALPEGYRPACLPVRIVQGSRKGPFATLGLAAMAWLMRGPASLIESQVIEVELGEQPRPLRLWARVALCTSEAEGFRLECRPFALSGATLTRWNELVRAAA